MFHKLCVVGGDVRALELSRLLRLRGGAVSTVGLEQGDGALEKLTEADALLFPYPFSAREGKVPTLTGLTLYIQDALGQAREGAALLVGGGMDATLGGERYRDKSWRVKRYADDERFLQANAALSAEGALFEAMKRCPVALRDATALVTGYGRFGRELAARLLALGARVWVGARREEQRLLAASDGMRALPLDELYMVVGAADIVLNTVPARVFSRRALDALPCDTPFLELASAPYSLGPQEALRRAPHYEILPALPARYAPRSAASALRDASLRLLTEGNRS